MSDAGEPLVITKRVAVAEHLSVLNKRTACVGIRSASHRTNGPEAPDTLDGLESQVNLLALIYLADVANLHPAPTVTDDLRTVRNQDACRLRIGLESTCHLEDAYRNIKLLENTQLLPDPDLTVTLE